MTNTPVWVSVAAFLLAAESILTMASKKPENMSLEASMAELEKVVAQLEQGELPLEDALKQFERGVSLVRTSQNKLDSAEQKIKILMERNGQAELVDTNIENLD